jgi:hypothetical protein
MTEDDIAKIIIGPWHVLPKGSRYTMEDLRSVRWGQANNSERSCAKQAARAIIREIGEKSKVTMFGVTQEMLTKYCDVNKLPHQLVQTIDFHTSKRVFKMCDGGAS